MDIQIETLFIGDQIFCIEGIDKAAAKFARDEEAHKEFSKLIRESHMIGYPGLIEHQKIVGLLSQQCHAGCLPKVLFVIVQEYKKLGYEYSEKCLLCQANSCANN
ncbi:MAG: hypothetical protein PHR61_05280 [Candidatus Absconditabacteria bacterium]|nr:hypothetical protein [Candidatus Absconditabacteria bacterium]